MDDWHLELGADVVCCLAVVATKVYVACSYDSNHEVVVATQEVLDWFRGESFSPGGIICGAHEYVGLLCF